MKVLLIVLLLAGMAWGGDIDWSQFKDGDFVCANGEGSYIPCPMLKAGHCPHCGAQYIYKGTDIFYYGRQANGRIDPQVGTMYLCPNGHIFWEKGQ